jgi:hypothetical protein
MISKDRSRSFAHNDYNFILNKLVLKDIEWLLRVTILH